MCYIVIQERLERERWEAEQRQQQEEEQPTYEVEEQPRYEEEQPTYEEEQPTYEDTRQVRWLLNRVECELTLLLTKNCPGQDIKKLL